jgi:hypothetical protein
MWSEFEHPWLLLLLILFLANLFFRRPKYFLRHANVQLLSENLKKNRLGSLIIASLSFLRHLSCLLLILAAADYSFGYKERTKKFLIHNYVLINDGSGSMVDEGMSNGVGQSLSVLLKGNDEFLKMLEKLEKSKNERDLVSAIVFSNDPYVVCYFTEDYDFIRKKLNYVDWRKRPELNFGTEIDKAFWVSLKLVLNDNQKKGGSSFTENELIDLETRLKGVNRNLILENVPKLKNKIRQIKKEIIGSVLVAFTDGEIIFDGDSSRLSVPKILLLCRELGVKVYLISVKKIEPDFMKYILATGGHGIILRSLDLEKTVSAYKEIVKSEAKEFLMVDRRLKKSYSDWLAGGGLALLIIYLVLRNTVSRSLTEI